jgi:hypothetical protein
VPITSADASLEQVLAAVPHVQNVLPEGSTWNGSTDLPMDEDTFKQMVSEIEPGSAAPGASNAPGASAAGTGAKAPAPAPPKNGG